jgi:hypothetical protein
VPRTIDEALLPTLGLVENSGAIPFVVDTTPDVTGPVNIADAAAQVTDIVAETQRLTDTGFASGYSRGWSTPSGDVISLVVYEFNSPESAQSYGAQDAAREIAEGAVTLDSIDFGELSADATWSVGSEYSATANGLAWRTLTVTFAVQNRWYQVTTGGPIEANGPAIASRDLVNSLAVAQLERVTSA